MPVLERVLHGRKSGSSRCHHLTLAALALSTGARNILELGHLRGETTEPLLLAAQASGGFVTTVDLNNSTFVAPPQLKHRWRHHATDAHSFLRGAVAARKVYDLVLVDDWHAAAHVREELRLLQAVTGPDSLILLHDLMTTALPPKERGGDGRRGETKMPPSVGGGAGRAAASGAAYDRARWASYNPPDLTSNWDRFSTGYDVFRDLDPRLWEWSTVPACHGLTMLRRKRCWQGAGSFAMPPTPAMVSGECPFWTLANTGLSGELP